MSLPNPRPLVIYHHNCADGFSAAWCFWRKFGQSVDFVQGRYGDAPPDVTGRFVVLADFSYPRAVVEKMLQTALCVVLLDHHKSALDDLAPLVGNPRFFMDASTVTKSGATIAWDYLFPNEPKPLLLGHVEDRDLWRFRLPHTREIQANLFSHAYSFETWDRLMAADQPELLKMTVAGAAIERKHHKDVAELVQACRRQMLIAGYEVPVASLPYTMASDAGALMAQDQLFAACYWDTPTHRQFSLRSTDEGLDVSTIAAFYGGGGHRNASGFRVPRDHALATA